jgi:hypothetical protein
MRRREFIKLLAGTAVALPVAVRSQQPSIWTIESFNISREPCVDLHVDVRAFFVASGVTAPESTSPSGLSRQSLSGGRGSGASFSPERSHLRRA